MRHENFKYEILADGTAVITRYSGHDAVLEIPSEIEGYRVTSIGIGAFENCINLKGIVIPDSVTFIGENAFCCCIRIKKTTINDSIVEAEGVQSDVF